MAHSPPNWAKKVLRSQRALLRYHAPNFKFTETTVFLPPHTINLVIARPDPPPSQSRVLLLLHGWGAGLAFFSRALPHLAAHFSAIYLADLPGMGASSRNRMARGAAVHHARDYFIHQLAGLCRHLSAEPGWHAATHRHLAAHSLGAYVSVEWLLRQPPQPPFDGVVLISPVGVPRRPPPAPRPGGLLRRVAAHVLSALWRAGVTPQTVLRLLPVAAGRRLCRRYVGARYTADLADEEAQLYAEYCLWVSRAPAAGEKGVSALLEPGAWAKVPLVDRLPGVQGCVAFVYGEKDWMDWSAGEQARGTMSGKTRLYRVEGADHNVFVDRPKEFGEVVVEACLAAEEADEGARDTSMEREG